MITFSLAHCKLQLFLSIVAHPLSRYILNIIGPDAEDDKSVSPRKLNYTFCGLQHSTAYKLAITYTFHFSYYEPFNYNNRIELQAVNRDNTTDAERASKSAVITVTTLSFGPPHVPDEPVISLITNTTVRVCWAKPGWCNKDEGKKE